MKALMMEATQTSDTSVNSYQYTRRYNPEGSHLHTRRRENLKSAVVLLGYKKLVRIVPLQAKAQIVVYWTTSPEICMNIMPLRSTSPLNCSISFQQ
jgi:hypothetical protein